MRLCAICDGKSGYLCKRREDLLFYFTYFMSGMHSYQTPEGHLSRRGLFVLTNLLVEAVESGGYQGTGFFLFVNSL